REMHGDVAAVLALLERRPVERAVAGDDLRAAVLRALPCLVGRALLEEERLDPRVRRSLERRWPAGCEPLTTAAQRLPACQHLGLVARIRLVEQRPHALEP